MTSTAPIQDTPMTVPTPHPPAKAEDTSHLYTILVALFTPLLLISNIAATKGVLLFEGLQIHLGPIQIDGLITDGAFFVFPLAYVMGDVITEVYGFKAMRRAMWLSFVVAVAATLIFTITLALPAAPFWTSQDAMAAILGSVPQILVASLAAYIAGTTLNAFTMSKLKARHGGKEPGHPHDQLHGGGRAHRHPGLLLHCGNSDWHRFSRCLPQLCSGWICVENLGGGWSFAGVHGGDCLGEACRADIRLTPINKVLR